MEEKSMTALVSAFARAYHAEHNGTKIFDDSRARQLFSDAEYAQMGATMAAGIGFFNPGFQGTPEEALTWIVDHQLSPTPLGRAAFAEAALENAVMLGARQYLILGAGYDTFAYRQPAWAKCLQIFEIDHPATAADQQERLMKGGLQPPENTHAVQADFSRLDWPANLLKHPAFDRSVPSFCSLLGLLYYLSKDDLASLLAALAALIPAGSALAFDYPDAASQTNQAGDRAKRQAQLAQGAGEKMQEGYSYLEMETLLAAHGFLIYEHLEPKEITARFFAKFNLNRSVPIAAFDNVNYCLAVKKQ